eukprot:1382654-Rhodomonas_salina.1
MQETAFSVQLRFLVFDFGVHVGCRNRARGPQQHPGRKPATEETTMTVMTIVRYPARSCESSFWFQWPHVGPVSGSSLAYAGSIRHRQPLRHLANDQPLLSSGHYCWPPTGFCPCLQHRTCCHACKVALTQREQGSVGSDLAWGRSGREGDLREAQKEGKSRWFDI